MDNETIKKELMHIFGEVSMLHSVSDRKGRLTFFEYEGDGEKGYSCVYVRFDDDKHFFYPKGDDFPTSVWEINKYKWYCNNGYIAGKDCDGGGKANKYARPRYTDKQTGKSAKGRPRIKESEKRVTLGCSVSQSTLDYLNNIKEITGLSLGKIIDDIILADMICNKSGNTK